LEDLGSVGDHVQARSSIFILETSRGEDVHGEIIHLGQPGGAKGHQSHTEDEKNEDDDRGPSGEIRATGPARVALPGKAMVGEGAAEASHDGSIDLMIEVKSGG